MSDPDRAYADTRPAAPAGAKTLPARYYTDPALFEREKDRIHRAMWNAAGPAADLAAAGDYRLVEVAGDSLIVVRDAAGALRAHHNVCRHRGTRLVEAEGGTAARFDPVPLPRLDLRPRRRPAERSPHGPRGGLFGFPLSARAGGVRGSGAGSSSSGSPPRGRNSSTSSGPPPNASRRGVWSGCAAPTPRPTRWTRTGSWWSRTSPSASTAR